MNYVILFILGCIEYILAAAWTHYFVSRQVARTGIVTLVSVCLWGFVVSSLGMGDTGLIVAHAIGCATGATGVCAFLSWSEKCESVEPTSGATSEPQP